MQIEYCHAKTAKTNTMQFADKLVSVSIYIVTKKQAGASITFRLGGGGPLTFISLYISEKGKNQSINHEPKGYMHRGARLGTILLPHRCFVSNIALKKKEGKRLNPRKKVMAKPKQSFFVDCIIIMWCAFNPFLYKYLSFLHWACPFFCEIFHNLNAWQPCICLYLIVPAAHTISETFDTDN